MEINENVYCGFSPVDVNVLKCPLTEDLKKSVKLENPKTVIADIDAYAAKRREEIRNTKTSVKVSGTSYFVSSDGCDCADGKTPETAWKTPARVSEAELLPGDGVFFRRGDLFRGFVEAKEGVTYSAYGEGEKPKLYASPRDYSETPFWDKTEKENIYVSKETFSEDVGSIIFDGGKSWVVKRAFGILDFDGVLRSDLEMFHNKEDNKLYLYSVSDPNTRFTSSEIGVHQSIIVTSNFNNITVDNLCLMYSGAFGVSGNYSEGLTVTNCEMGWLGGSLQNCSNGRIVRYGNGVEIYGSCKDLTVKNCYVYQVYDAGITFQYFNFPKREKRIDMENVDFSDNFIEYCTYNIEYCDGQPADNAVMKNIRMTGNILLHAGEGWGNQRPVRSDACIKGWPLINHSADFIISDNIITTMDDKCCHVIIGGENPAFLPALVKNIFVGKKGNKFGLFDLMTVKPDGYPIYDEHILENTHALESNTFIFAE